MGGGAHVTPEIVTVVCLFIRGEYPYTPEYVTRLRDMACRYLVTSVRSARFVCLTDRPELFTRDTAMDIIHVGRLPARYAFWSKLLVFNPDYGFTGRMLWLDLDVLVVNDLGPIVDFPAPFAFAADMFAATGDGPAQESRKDGRRYLPKYQGSVMVWNAGEQADLFTDWDPRISEEFYTDQDYYAARAPHAARMPVAWFPRISLVHPPWPAEAKVVLVKKPKNHVALERWPWFRQYWGAA